MTKSMSLLPASATELILAVLLVACGPHRAADPSVDGGIDGALGDGGFADGAPDGGPADARVGEDGAVDAGFDPLQVSTTCGTPAGASFPTRLTVHPTNPRYFADGDGEAVMLRGLHYWNNLQDYPMDQDIVMDYCAYVDHMAATSQNLMRMWSWESTRNTSGQLASPMPYLRVSGTALDGGPKYDLDQLDPDYFDRLRDRVLDAGKRGIYVSIMLFQGHSGTRSNSGQENTWQTHFYHRDNNLNGIDGDPNGDGHGVEVHTMAIPAITELQRLYVERVIATVHDLDNVLFEVCNECEADQDTWDWSNVVIDFVQAHEPTVWGSAHPIGFSNQMDPAWNAAMYQSNADYVAPGHHWYTDWADADGSKVQVLDTDHISPYDFDDSPVLQRQWAWKQFTRGYSLWFMLLDVDGPTAAGTGWTPLGFDGALEAMQRIGGWADDLDLASLTPRSDLCTYCLVSPGETYLVYLPDGGSLSLSFPADGSYLRQWYNPRNGGTNASDVLSVTAGARQFTAPNTSDWVLYLERQP